MSVEPLSLEIQLWISFLNGALYLEIKEERQRNLILKKATVKQEAKIWWLRENWENLQSKTKFLTTL